MKFEDPRLKILLAALLTAGMTGSAWAGEGRGERIRGEETIVHYPCASLGVGGANLPELPGVAVRSRGFLGVELTALTPDLRRHFSVPDHLGVMVGKVVEDSAAFRASLKVGDILTRVDGKSLVEPWELTSAVQGKSDGEVVGLEYWRDGQVGLLSVALDSKVSCTVTLGPADLGSTIDRIEELGEQLPDVDVRIDARQVSEKALSEAMHALDRIDWEEHLQGLRHVEISVKLEGKIGPWHDQGLLPGERIPTKGGTYPECTLCPIPDHDVPDDDDSGGG